MSRAYRLTRLPPNARNPACRPAGFGFPRSPAAPRALAAPKGIGGPAAGSRGGGSGPRIAGTGPSSGPASLDRARLDRALRNWVTWKRLGSLRAPLALAAAAGTWIMIGRFGSVGPSLPNQPASESRVFRVKRHPSQGSSESAGIRVAVASPTLARGLPVLPAPCSESGFIY
jgi:hypothetical protein